MSKTIEIDSCIVCPSFDHEEYTCEKMERHNGTSIIPEWCPLPDSKPYKYATAKEALSGRWVDEDTFTDGFESARERKEG